MKQKLIEFMRGRYLGVYGMDALNKFLIALYLIVVTVLTVTGKRSAQYFEIITLLMVFLIYYRMFSKNLSARVSENQKFLEITSNIRKPLKRFKNNVADREYKYIECPVCKKELRVPRKKGKIKVTCKKCGNKFDVRS